MDNTRKGFKLTPTDKDKRIAELEEKISVLLSCKNCPENKGGFICVKEYEDKCLAQKIQYIKELKEEIKNLKKTYCKQRNKRIDDLQKENAELKKLKRECETSLCRAEYQYNYEQLTKAKELLKELVTLDTYYDWNLQLAHDVEQFLNSEVEKEKPAVQRRELHFDHQAQSYVGE